MIRNLLCVLCINLYYHEPYYGRRFFMNLANKPRCRFLASCLLGAALALMTIGTLPTGLTAAPIAADVTVALPNHAPADFIQVRPDIPKGKLETITYSSKSIGVDRKAVIYLPPNYNATRLIGRPSARPTRFSTTSLPTKKLRP
jgi:hypothetical protein